MIFSATFSQKAVDAALAAIEIYNKPDFRFREEAFSLLMCNAWELLLKARWLQDHEESLESLYEIDRASGQPRLNRCKNPITFGASYLAAKLLEDSNSGLTKPVYDNLIALIEIRDNSAHFINKDLHFGRRILEIGTASLQNFLRLITEWFQVDMSRYNFFLMPISFYHGFEAIQSSSVSPYPVQMRRLLDYIGALCDENKDIEEPGHSVSVRMETRFVRAKDAEAIAFRFTDDPNAPEVTLREEDVLKNYPLDYRKLCEALRRRYVNFLENREFHRHRKEIETEKKFSIVRFLDPGNPKSAKKRLYNTNIIQEFDKYYQKRTANKATHPIPKS